MSFDITPPPGAGKRDEGRGKREENTQRPIPNTQYLTPDTQSLNTQNSTAASPIADLSYRNYDGPLHTRTLRWWTITLGVIRLHLKKAGFWIVIVLATLPYLFSILALYLQGQAGGALPNPMTGGAAEVKYAPNFYQAFQVQQFFLFILALVVGSGVIAADNRANALLVYLSKPITKGDYLLGKWMSIFLTLFLTGFIPAFVMYAYCLLSYTSNGFLKNEPYLFLQILGAAMVPGMIHASLMVGLSAWSKTPRLAGATYAGVFFIGNTLAALFWGIRYKGDMAKGILERHLSVDGVIQGLAQNILDVTLRVPQMRRRTMEANLVELAPPELWPLLLLGAALVVIGIVAARFRIRAVEVVRG